MKIPYDLTNHPCPNFSQNEFDNSLKLCNRIRNFEFSVFKSLLGGAYFNKLAIVLGLLFLVNTNISARAWKYPMEGSTFKRGEKVFFGRNPDPLDRNHRIEIFFVGTRMVNGIPTPIAKEKIESYTINFNCSTNEFHDLEFDYTPRCDQWGEYIVDVYTTKRSQNLRCVFQEEEPLMDSRRFTVLPMEAVIVELPAQQFVCPNTLSIITINNPNNIYSDALWFNTLVGGNPFHQGFTYEKNYPELSSESYYIRLNKDNGFGCLDTSTIRQMITVISSDKIPLASVPSKQFKLLCRAATDTVKILPRYDGANWYTSNPDVPVLSGPFEYSQYFQGPVHLISVEYYQNLPGGCVRKSPKSLISLSVLSVDIDVTIQQIDIKDHRDYFADCYDYAPFYNELDKLIPGVNLTTLMNTAQLAVIAAVSSISSLNPVLKLKYVGSSSSYWDPKDYYTRNGTKTVCSDNITPTQGVYGAKAYRLKFNNSIQVYGYNSVLDSNFIYFDIPSCEFPVGYSKVIRNTPPGTNSPEETCIPPTLDSLTAIYDPTLSCKTSVVRRICPGESLTIGPAAPGLPINSYSWSPTTGLSNPNSKNPTVSYASVPVKPYQVMKYELETTTVNPLITTTENHCTYIYKCLTCGQPDTIIEDTINSIP